MDEVVGTTLKGNQFNGSAYVAGLPIVPGVTPRTQGAVMFDGSTNRVQFLNTYSMCIVNLEKCPNGITIAAWLKPGTKQALTWFYFSTGGHTPGGHGWTWYQNSGKINFQAQTTSKIWSLLSATLPLDTWSHVITSWHELEGVKMFVNFKLVAEATTPTIDAFNNVVIDLTIGSALKFDVRFLGNFTIDEFHIWQKKCTDDIIREIQLMKYYEIDRL